MVKEHIMVTLVASDKKEKEFQIEVEESVAKASKLLKRTIDCGTVKSICVENVMDYCKYHMAPKAVRPSMEEIKRLDLEIVQVDMATLLQLLLAADHMEISSLIDLMVRSLSGTLVGKTAEEIRRIFNSETDFTPEQEAEVRQENQWAFDPVV
ncbi:unnamed protein product [Calypogeia fissa]